MSEPSLNDFIASKDSRPRRCATCTLPPEILAEVNASLRRKPRHKAITEWLNNVKGIYTTSTSYHFNAGHHLEDV